VKALVLYGLMMSCVKEVKQLCPSVYSLDGEYTTAGTMKMPLWSVPVSIANIIFTFPWCIPQYYCIIFLLDPNVTDQFAVRLVDDNGNISSSSGSVEVLHAGLWGGVCNTYWGIADANVVCRQLGYSHAIQAIRYHLQVYGFLHGQIGLPTSTEVAVIHWYVLTDPQYIPDQYG